MKLKIKLAAILSVLWMTTGTVQAGAILNIPIVGGNFFVASDGNVFAKYVGSSASYFSTLYFGEREVFDKSANVGIYVDLGDFSEGEQLTFSIFVNELAKSFVSGGGADNPDGLAHFRAITTFNGGNGNGLLAAVGTGFLTTVGFEDQLGGGDRDFNDFMFSLSNVIDPPPNEPPVVGPAAVSEPPVLFLLACGIVGLLARRRQPV
jgi:hypothetical protein